ncbi:MAG: two-component system, OmpR family, sensor histidine kinase ResE [Clostridia bacterium]|nr:two-component system, OmpR family, sensor histidine kinase ResE [Clostridia bacterium]
MGRSLFHKLLASYLIIILVTLGTVGVLLSKLFSDYYFAFKEKELVARGKEISRIISLGISKGDWESSFDVLLQAADRSLNARILAIDRNGRVIANTIGGRMLRGMILDPSETVQVLQGKTISRRGFSPRFNQIMVSAAVPIQVGSEIVGALLLYTPVADLTPAVDMVEKLILYAAGGAVFLAMLIGYYLSKSISRPLRHMSQITREMARGNFKQRVVTASQDEVGELARNFNELAIALEDTINTLKQEKQKMANILANMAEGVLAVDSQGRLLLANARAAKTLALPDGDFLGRSLTELIPHPELKEFFQTILQERQSMTAEFRLNSGQFFLAHVSPLKEKEEIYGAVIVLQDISELRQLEELRRDFVANVSHELKTPLTSIQGFVEALMDGLINDPATEARYLKVIHQETLRLNRLVQDLLDLALMEAKKIEWEMRPLKLAEICTQVLQKLTPQIQAKDLKVSLDVPAYLPPVLGNNDRIEQVLINLLSNAVQFTPAGGRINIKALNKGDMIEVQVQDDGQGIPPEDLPYIWERFHKVDKSRTRGQGGTGLGLAIVKHIVEAHGGRVGVKSKVGEGSIFSFSLPVYQA